MGLKFFSNHKNLSGQVLFSTKPDIALIGPRGIAANVMGAIGGVVAGVMAASALIGLAVFIALAAIVRGLIDLLPPIVEPTCNNLAVSFGCGY